MVRTNEGPGAAGTGCQLRSSVATGVAERTHRTIVRANGYERSARSNSGYVGTDVQQRGGRAERRRRPAKNEFDFRGHALSRAVVVHWLTPDGLAKIGGAVFDMVQDFLRHALIVHQDCHDVFL